MRRDELIPELLSRLVRSAFMRAPIVPDFKVGDVVSRDGSDRQLVIEVTDSSPTMTVRCIRAPSSGWCAVGDEEFNLRRRYVLAPESDERSRP